MNVFGTPITKCYRFTQLDLAKDAMKNKNAEGKDVAALNSLKRIEVELGESGKGITMCLVYNATGFPVTFVGSRYWDGLVSASNCPTIIANGQWGAFLCLPIPPTSKITAAFVYRGRNCAYKDHFATAFATTRCATSLVCTEIRSPSTITGNAIGWNDVNGKLFSGGHSAVDHALDVSIYASVGDGDTHILEVV